MNEQSLEDDVTEAIERSISGQGSTSDLLIKNPAIPISDASNETGLESNHADSNVTTESVGRSTIAEVEIPGATSFSINSDSFGFEVHLSADYLFKFDQSTLTPKAQATLNEILALYKQYDGSTIEVAGHTDSKGSSSYNITLSEQRADAVKNWFQSNDIDSSLMNTNGYGESQPVAPNIINGHDNPAGQMLNRRVSIFVKTETKIDRLSGLKEQSSLDAIN